MSYILVKTHDIQLFGLIIHDIQTHDIIFGMDSLAR